MHKVMNISKSLKFAARCSEIIDALTLTEEQSAPLQRQEGQEER